MNELDSLLGELVREHIVKNHGHLDVNTVMAFTGCNEQLAQFIYQMWMFEIASHAA